MWRLAVSGNRWAAQAKRQSERTEAVQNRFHGSEVAFSQTREDGLAAFEPDCVLERFNQ
jgi:hypothetical protein